MEAGRGLGWQARDDFTGPRVARLSKGAADEVAGATSPRPEKGRNDAAE